MDYDHRVPGSYATKSRRICLERVLVGVDFRQPSLAAAKWAAAQFGSSTAIELAHVLTVPEVPRFVRSLTPRWMTSWRWRQPVRCRPAGFATTMPAKHVSAQVRIGRPVDGLAERAKAFEADLVVLGRMTVNGVRGRTLERLIRRLAVPALVVGGGVKDRPRRILAAWTMPPSAPPW